MILVDVHCHLDHEYFKDKLDEVLKRAKEAGIRAIITQGVNHESNEKLLELAKKDPIIKPAMGLYPLDPPNVKLSTEDPFMSRSKVSVDKTLAFIEKNKNNIIAIGEVGMDFKFSDDEEPQAENFKKIIDLARKIKKPLIIHSRKAEKSVIDLLEDAKFFNADMHCFSGKKSQLKRGADLGLFFSIPTNVTRSDQFQSNVSHLPMANILTETDAPWLSPYPGKMNEPAFIKEAVEKIAEIKKLTAEEAANQIFQNYQKLFL
ncbi:TatD family hydrolase [Candidatus Woesearchaeota archaeon]|nr:TatD family hydrolase [Candidatus Woesearchaeota archaeon]